MAAAGSKHWMDRVRHMVICLGGSMDPETAYLLIRGMKTLGLRVKKQGENAMTVAKFLEKHPKVERVHYPGLPSHADHALAERQMRGFGSMLAFDVRGGLDAARRVFGCVALFFFAGALGGVGGLVVVAVYTSPFKLSKGEVRRAG